MTRILIADDHSIVRFGTALLINEMFSNRYIAEAVSLNDILTQIDKEYFDLLILDINIPGGDNLQMIEVLRVRHPELKILIFSGYDENLFAIRYLQAGVNGYLMKDSSQQELKLAIQAVLKNDIYASPKIKQQLLNNLAGKRVSASNPLQSLSDRESEVMHQLIKGHGIAEISKMMHLQISTISTYKTRLFEKLEVSNVVDLVEKVKLYNV